jgi:hypothetical protein
MTKASAPNSKFAQKWLTVVQLRSFVNYLGLWGATLVLQVMPFLHKLANRYHQFKKLNDMTIKPEYSKYRRRILKPILKFLIFPVIYIVSPQREETGVFAGILGILSIIGIISVLKESKNYLTQIRLANDYYEFETVEYDKPQETIKTKVADTKIKISYSFFSSLKTGKSFKLIVETRQGSTYKNIIEQYEVGNWTREEFEKILNLYREAKFISSSTPTFNEYNSATKKE